MAGIIPTSGTESFEVSLHVQGFLDQFERLNQPAGYDISEDQLREQVQQMSSLHDQVNVWTRDYFNRHDSVDAMVETTDLVIAIESAIDERYTILIG